MPRRTDEFAQQVVENTARELQVEPARGLSDEEARARLEHYGVHLN
jgi:hypothetical protein